jgi:RNA polymerase sigma-70 factor, ECF subfamily
MSRGKVVLLPRSTGAGGGFSDEALVAACAVGDAAALEALFDRYHADVYRFLGRLARADAQDLADLVQSVFLKVQRAAGRFRRGSQVKTWLLGIAVNVARNHARSEARRRVFLSALAGLPAERAPLPDETAAQREELSRVRAALASLPHELRAVFLLCEIEGFSGEEAARALGIRPGTLWRRLSEARNALRVLLEGGDR